MVVLSLIAVAALTCFPGKLYMVFPLNYTLNLLFTISISYCITWSVCKIDDTEKATMASLATLSLVSLLFLFALVKN